MVERIVIESLSRQSKNLGELYDDTSLDYGLLNCILGVLLQKNILTYKHGKYSLSSYALSGQLTRKEGVKEEVKELMDSLLEGYMNQRPSAALKVQKVWMNEKEEKIFKAQLISLEQFLNSLEGSKQGKTKNQKCIVWGHSSYEVLLQENLKQVS